MLTRRTEFRGPLTYLFFLAILVFRADFAISAQPAIDTPMATGVIIKYRGEHVGTSLNARTAVASSIARARGSELTYERAAALGRHVLKLDRTRPVADVRELAQAIAAGDPEIEYAEPNVLMFPMLVPNDPLYSQQWHYFESTAGINLPAAWDLSTGSGVRVAVLDTGYLPHADLAANIVPGYDFMSNVGQSIDGNGRDSDPTDPGDGVCGSGPSSWHGTHVAGTIAAATNNSTGVAGVAFNSQIVPIRVLGCSGEYGDIADAIVWAAGGSVPGVPANSYPARVLNLSLGGGASCGAFMQDAINSARSMNSVVVVAAGNSATDASLFTPGNCSGVITVAAVDRAGNRAQFNSNGTLASNTGATVEIAAPGGETYQSASNGVLSTLNTGDPYPVSDSYAFKQGTSMAAPHVAGLAALMVSANSSLTPDNVLSMMQSTARLFPGSCSQCGSGIIHAENAVRAALGLPPAPPGDTMTMVSGGSGPSWGYIQGSFGSLTPNVTSSGKTYRAIYASYNYYTNVKAVHVSVCGFTSSPGSSWLTSWTENGTTRLGSSAAFSYQSSGSWAGCATWTWNVSTWIVFGSQQTVVHQ